MVIVPRIVLAVNGITMPLRCMEWTTLAPGLWRMSMTLGSSLRYELCLRWRERISRIRPSGATSRLLSDGELGHSLWSTENRTRQGIDGRVRLDRSLPVSIVESILGSTPTPSAGVTSQIVDGVCARHSPCTRPAEPVCRCCQSVNS